MRPSPAPTGLSLPLPSHSPRPQPQPLSLEQPFGRFLPSSVRTFFRSSAASESCFFFSLFFLSLDPNRGRLPFTFLRRFIVRRQRVVGVVVVVVVVVAEEEEEESRLHGVRERGKKADLAYFDSSAI